MFNWCHGPNCHKKEILSRVRGSKGNKVLRTMKVKYRQQNDNYWFRHWWNYFCNQSCLMDYINTHIQSIVAIAPRREPLETPIKDPTKNNDNHYYNSWTIEKRV